MPQMTSDDLLTMIKRYIDEEKFEMAAKVCELLAEECRKLVKEK